MEILLTKICLPDRKAWTRLQHLLRGKGWLNIRPGGKASALTWLKSLAELEPEFKENPSFMVEEKGDKKVLVFKSRDAKYRIFAYWFGLSEEELKGVQKVSIDLTSLYKRGQKSIQTD